MSFTNYFFTHSLFPKFPRLSRIATASVAVAILGISYFANIAVAETSSTCKGAIPLDVQNQTLSGVIDPSVPGDTFQSPKATCLESPTNAGGPGHVYSIQVDGETLLNVNSLGDPRVVIEVRSACADSGSLVKCRYANGRSFHGSRPVDVILHPNQTYYLVVMVPDIILDGLEFRTGERIAPYDLELQFTDLASGAASGPTCEAAKLLDAVPQSIAGTFRGTETTREGAIICDERTSNDLTHIYKFVPTTDQVLQIEGQSADSSFTIAVRESECSGVESEIECQIAQDRGSDVHTSLVSMEVALRANTEYFLHVSSSLLLRTSTITYAFNLDFQPIAEIAETRADFGPDGDDLMVRLGVDRWVLDMDTTDVYRLSDRAPVSIRTFLTKWYEAKGKTPYTTTKLFATHGCHNRNAWVTRPSPQNFNLRYVTYSEGVVFDFESTAGGEGASYMIQGPNASNTIRWGARVRKFEGGTASFGDAYNLTWTHRLNGGHVAWMRHERGQWRLLVKQNSISGFSNRTSCGADDPVRKDTILRWSLPGPLHNFEDMPAPTAVRDHPGDDGEFNNLLIRIGAELWFLDGDNGRVERFINGKAFPRNRTIRHFVDTWYEISGEPVQWADMVATYSCPDKTVEERFPKVHHSRPKNFQLKTIAWDKGLILSAGSWGRADYVLQGVDPSNRGDLSSGVIVRAFQGGFNIHTKQGDRVNFRHKLHQPNGRIDGNRVILPALNATGAIKTECGAKSTIVPDSEIQWVLPEGILAQPLF